MQLSALVTLVGRVRATSKKGEKVSLLADLLCHTRGEETALVALYLAGTLPQGRVGVGWRTLQAATSDALPAGEPLALGDVDAAFGTLAADSGPGSTARRGAILRELLARAAPEERRFLAALLMGEVRQGALEGLLLEAIAKAAGLPAADVRQAAMFSGNVGEIARAAIEQGAAGLDRFSLRVLAPVAPMLASPAEDPAEALERLSQAAFEYKVDGARIQVHRKSDEIRVFTRQLQDVTERVPEIAELARALPVTDVVLEGEAIALRSDGRPHPFQVTMRRFGRSREIEPARRELPLSSFFFDCLYAGEAGPVTSRPYTERYALMARIVPVSSLLPRIVTGDAAEAQRFLQAALDAGHEGLMAKALDAPYVAGQRGFHWLKLKAAKTLDLVVLAAEWGSGRRRGWLSNLHLGARDPGGGGFVMLGKTFKGLTDEMLRWQTERLLSLETRRDEHTVYVRPELVVEVAFGDVQESPRYPARLALRFARVKAFRSDKPAAEADTIEAVRQIFERQRA